MMFWFYFALFISLSNFSSSSEVTPSPTPSPTTSPTPSPTSSPTLRPTPSPDNCTECSPEYCPTTSPPCLHGTIGDERCKCCEFCLKGPGESCGGFVRYPSICAKGHYCLFSALIHQIPDIGGTCVEGERINSTNCTECSKYFCTKFSCKYGSLPNPNCDCCKVCLKGPGECYGGLPLTGICAEGYHCHKFYESEEAAGVCVENSPPDNCQCCEECPGTDRDCECCDLCTDCSRFTCGGFANVLCPKNCECVLPSSGGTLGQCKKSKSG